MEAATQAPDGAEERTLEPVPDPEPEVGADDRLVVEGSSGQLSMNVGGKKPVSSSLRLVGGKLEVEGQFQKGERIRAEVELEVGEIAFRDKHDSATGEVVSCDRAHRARVVAFQRL